MGEDEGESAAPRPGLGDPRPRPDPGEEEKILGVLGGNDLRLPTQMLQAVR